MKEEHQSGLLIRAQGWVVKLDWELFLFYPHQIGDFHRRPDNRFHPTASRQDLGYFDVWNPPEMLSLVRTLAVVLVTGLMLTITGSGVLVVALRSA